MRGVCFLWVNGSGTLSAPSAPTASLIAVRDKARANNAKVFLGINDGSGDGKTNFKNMAATACGSNNFIKDVMNVVRANNLDGVDMDWEFPTTADGTDATFTLLMKELSDSLHRDARYYLSALPSLQVNMQGASGMLSAMRYFPTLISLM